MVQSTEKPEELVNAMEAIKNAILRKFAKALMVMCERGVQREVLIVAKALCRQLFIQSKSFLAFMFLG